LKQLKNPQNKPSPLALATPGPKAKVEEEEEEEPEEPEEDDPEQLEKAWSAASIMSCVNDVLTLSSEFVVG